MTPEPSTHRARLRNPRQASDYLREQHGIVRAVSTLAKLRCVGGGPTFHKLGDKYVGYAEPALDTYAESLISRPLRSTSETA